MKEHPHEGIKRIRCRFQLSLVYSYRKFHRSVLLWGATPAPRETEAGGGQGAARGGLGVTGGAGSRSTARGPGGRSAHSAVLPPLHPQRGRAGRRAAWLLARTFLAAPCRWKRWRERLVLGSGGASCWWAGEGPLLGYFGAPSVEDKSVRAHVEGPMCFSACPFFRIG